MFEENFIVEGAAQTDLRGSAEVIELGEEFGDKFYCGALPFNMTFARDFIPILVDVAQEQLVFAADTIGDGL